MVGDLGKYVFAVDEQVETTDLITGPQELGNEHGADISGAAGHIDGTNRFHEKLTLRCSGSSVVAGRGDRHTFSILATAESCSVKLARRGRLNRGDYSCRIRR